MWCILTLVLLRNEWSFVSYFISKPTKWFITELCGIIRFEWGCCHLSRCICVLSANPISAVSCCALGKGDKIWPTHARIVIASSWFWWGGDVMSLLCVLLLETLSAISSGLHIPRGYIHPRTEIVGRITKEKFLNPSLKCEYPCF